jgi:hypothetical protein
MDKLEYYNQVNDIDIRTRYSLLHSSVFAATVSGWTHTVAVAMGASIVLLTIGWLKVLVE